MLEGKALVKETDMPEKMQLHAMSFASQALDLYDVCDCISIAGTSRRSLIRCMGVDGNVWWVPILGAFSVIHQGLSYILLWRPLIFSSIREPPLSSYHLRVETYVDSYILLELNFLYVQAEYVCCYVEELCTDEEIEAKGSSLFPIN